MFKKLVLHSTSGNFFPLICKSFTKGLIHRLFNVKSYLFSTSYAISSLGMKFAYQKPKNRDYKNPMDCNGTK